MSGKFGLTPTEVSLLAEVYKTYSVNSNSSRDIDVLIGEANESLREQNIRLVIEKRGERLNLRGTLPPKQKGAKWKQQRIPTGSLANPQGIVDCVKKAHAVWQGIADGTFLWDKEAKLGYVLAPRRNMLPKPVRRGVAESVPKKCIESEQMQMAVGVNCHDMPEEKLEIHVQSRLAGFLNAQKEVHCKYGRIDVLTITEVIEVKQAKAWKSAVGQALVYVQCFTDRTPRIHLYGDLPKSDRALIETACHSLGVRVTWDEDIDERLKNIAA